MKNASQYRRIATAAARLELAGNYGQAASMWRKASLVAVLDVNQRWCEGREHHCEKRVGHQGYNRVHALLAELGIPIVVDWLAEKGYTVTRGR